MLKFYIIKEEGKKRKQVFTIFFRKKYLYMLFYKFIIIYSHLKLKEKP